MRHDDDYTRCQDSIGAAVQCPTIMQEKWLQKRTLELALCFLNYSDLSTFDFRRKSGCSGIRTTTDATLKSGKISMTFVQCMHVKQTAMHFMCALPLWVALLRPALWNTVHLFQTLACRLHPIQMACDGVSTWSVQTSSHVTG